MDPQRLLTHLSGEQIFSFLCINARRSLAKRCPRSRNWNRKFPYRLVKLEISIRTARSLQVNLNGIEWKFDTDKEVITFPSGRQERSSDPNAANKLLKFYFGRKGTRISELCVELFRHITVTTKPLHIFEYFEKVHLEKLSILALDDLWQEEDSEHLRSYKLHTELFTLEVGLFADGSMSTNFEFAKVSLLRENIGDECDFLEQCQEIIAGKYPIGSEFQTHFLRHRMVNFEWFVDGLGGEVKYTNAGSGICVPIDSEIELFVTVEEFEFSQDPLRTFKFTAAIQKANLSGPYEEMSIRGKLWYWYQERRFLVFCKLKKLELFVALKLCDSKLLWGNLPEEEEKEEEEDDDDDDPFASHREEWRRTDASYALYRRYRMLIPVLLSEVALSILSLIMFQSYFTFSPLIILIPLLSVLLILTYLFFRFWPSSEKKDSYLPVMPPRYFPDPRFVEGLF